MRVGSLFSGIGGLDLAVEAATGGHTVWQVEQSEPCRQVLARHWPEAERFDDVRTVGAHNLEPVDILIGGFPCQDLSCAGSRKGLKGERSGLFFEFARIANELQPAMVIVENVPGLLKHRGLVDQTFANAGYRTTWARCYASSAGAPHLRRRVFLVAKREGSAAFTLQADMLDLPKTPAATWPTPTASRANESETVESWLARRDRVAQYSRPLSPPLGLAVRMSWPTPTCGDAKASGSRSLPSSEAHAGTSLTDAVRPDRSKATWPTPAARDYRSGSHRSDNLHPNREGSFQLPEVLRGRLNSDWVETLMGLPVGWTLTAGSSQRSEAIALLNEPRWPADKDQDQLPWEPSRLEDGPPVRGRPARMIALGNAVVPQQALLALDHLLSTEATT